MRATRILTAAFCMLWLVPNPVSAQYFPASTASTGTVSTGTASTAASRDAIAEARLVPAQVSAWDQQEALLHVERFGRYALTVDSPRGVALQLIDRMAGPGEVVGVAGEQDGRLDLFLDRGTYKVMVFGPKSPNGGSAIDGPSQEQATLRVHEFVEANATGSATAGGPPRLLDLKPISTSLEDFQYRSYWLQVEQAKWVYLEAAGRHLEDLRLWQDGSWLLDTDLDVEVVMPAPGQPLAVHRITAFLQPGLYLLSAYGGVGQPWAEDDGSRPFHLRAGIPHLAEAGRRSLEVSPFGVDRFLVPQRTNFFRIELPEATDASLKIYEFEASGPYYEPDYADTAQVQKNSVPPVAELRFPQLEAEDRFAGSTDGDEDREGPPRVISVRAAAGQPYVLQHFEQRNLYHFWRGGEYWLSTVHSGPVGDSVDATAIVARWIPSMGLDREPFLAQAIDIGGDQAWARRCNLLADLTVHLRVRQTGRYEVLSDGVEAVFRFEPFMVDPPNEYEPPLFRAAGAAWDLDAGYYVLTVRPKKRGILDVAVRPTGMVATLLDLIGARGAVETDPVRAAVRFGRVRLNINHSYTLFPNQQPEVNAGLVLRRLPLDLTRALPLAQRPGESVEVPFRATEPGRLTALTETGTRLQVSLDGTAWADMLQVPVGTHNVQVRDPAEQGLTQTQLYNLELVPERLLATSPLPPLPHDALASLPDFPNLAAGQPRYLDLSVSDEKTYLVDAAEPALYRLESSGLLATEGNLRSRVVTSLDRQESNGVGRNFLVQQFLSEGDYQLSVSTLGASEGHLGLHLRQSPLIDGGQLVPGVPARLRLPAGEAVVYRFHIPEGGRYRLVSYGLQRVFRGRLEDGDGWPILEPNQSTEWNRRFDAGDYRLVVLPESVDNRAVTLLEEVPEPPEFSGHGPHALPFDVPVRHLWQEPEQAERTPDVWEVEIPADLTIQISLTDEMTGELQRWVDGTWQPQLIVPPERGWSGELEAGRYRLAVTCVRRNNRVSYWLRVSPYELTEGITRELQAPVDMPLVIGEAGLIEMRSFGSVDVRARLYQGSRLIASYDDHPEDWNFQLAATLQPGRYNLRLDPVGTATATTRVSVSRPSEHDAKALTLPTSTRLALDEQMWLLPLQLPRSASLLLAAAGADQTLGLALEAQQDGAWRTLAQDQGRAPRVAVALPEDSSATYRLRLWSLDRRPGNVDLTASAVKPRGRSEQTRSEQARSEQERVTLEAVEGMSGGARSARVASFDQERPGSFRVTGSDLLACTEVHRPCVPVDGETLVPASGEQLHLVEWSGTGTSGGVASSGVTVERLRLPAGTASTRVVRLPAGSDGRPDAPMVLDLAAQDGRGGPVVALARSVMGQPVLTFGSEPPRAVAANGAAHGAANGAANGAGNGAGSALAVQLQGAARPIAAWAAGDSDLTDVRVHQLRYREVVYEPPFFGRLEGGLASVAARGFALPDGTKQLRLALGSELLAVLSRGDEVLSVHWAGGEPFEATVDSPADRLTLLHTAEGGHRYDIEVFPLASVDPASGAGARLTTKAPFSEAFTRRGTRELDVPAAEGVLHVLGTSGTAQLVDAPQLLEESGRVQRGTELTLHGVPARLSLPHGPGRVIAWIERDGVPPSGGSWFPDGPPPSIEVQAPAVVPLDGIARRLVLDLSTASLIHLRSDQPGLTVVRVGIATDAAAGAAVEPEERLALHPHGIAVDAYLGAGVHELWLRALDGTLSASAELTITSVSEIGEGLGPEVLLPAGGSRAFRFTVPNAASNKAPAGGTDESVQVGVGVRADSDRVEVRVLDAAGNELGQDQLGRNQPSQGVVLMPRLTPGTYLLELTLPADAAPARARPAVVGLDRPSTGPPPDVIRQYLDLAEDASEGASR